MDPPAPAGGDGLLGRVLGGRYRCVRPLGEGGMGMVYLCEHTVLGRRFAVKVLRPECARDPELKERFRTEAIAASRIGRDHVVDVLDCGEDPDGVSYYVMEALEGRSLGAILREEGPLALERAFGLLDQVCRALAAAHARGVVHRDVKPDNVFVVRGANGGERVKILDFGISQVSDRPASGRITRDGAIMGTPEYMAPEQAAGTGVDHRADVYAAGVLAYEMLTGELPLVEETPIATLVAHQVRIPEAPGLRQPGIPPEADALVLRALAKRPADRFDSMLAFAAEIARIQPRFSRAPPPGRAREAAVTARFEVAPRSSGTGSLPEPARGARPRRLAGSWAYLAAGAAAGLVLAAAVGLLLPGARPRHGPAQPAGVTETAVGRPSGVAAAPAASPPAPPGARAEPPLRARSGRAARIPVGPEVKDPYAEDADVLKPDPFR